MFICEKQKLLLVGGYVSAAISGTRSIFVRDVLHLLTLPSATNANRCKFKHV